LKKTKNTKGSPAPLSVALGVRAGLPLIMKRKKIKEKDRK